MNETNKNEDLRHALLSAMMLIKCIEEEFHLDENYCYTVVNEEGREEFFMAINDIRELAGKVL